LEGEGERERRRRGRRMAVWRRERKSWAAVDSSKRTAERNRNRLGIDYQDEHILEMRVPNVRERKREKANPKQEEKYKRDQKTKTPDTRSFEKNSASPSCCYKVRRKTTTIE